MIFLHDLRTSLTVSVLGCVVSLVGLFGCSVAFGEIFVEISGHYFTPQGQRHSTFQMSRFSDDGPISYTHLALPLRTEAFRPIEGLAFVYDRFEQEAFRRVAMRLRTREVLSAEDAILLKNDNALGFLLFQMPGEVAAYFQLYGGEPTTSRKPLPFQSSIPGLALKHAHLGLPAFEIRRLAKDPLNKEFDLALITKLIAFHLKSVGFPDFVLYAHTDAFGARLFSRYGFEVELRPSDVGRENEYVLSARAESFFKRVFLGDFLASHRDTKADGTVCSELSVGSGD